MVLANKVTLPFSAKALPFSTAPVFMVTEV